MDGLLDSNTIFFCCGLWCRYRNFEQLHRRLKDVLYYTLSLPPKRFLSSNLDTTFVRERCILLDKYLKVSAASGFKMTDVPK